MMIETSGQIPSPAESADLLQQVREAVTADLSREMLLRVLTHWLPAIAAAAAVFLFGRILVRLAVRMIEQASRRARMDETLSKFLSNFASIILQLVVCIASLSCLGIDTTSLSAVLVASGFAIGMALQGSLGNVASGVLLVFFRPFRVGDTIEVAGVIGRVVEIQIFNTILLSPDNVRIIQPNASITGGTIRNLSAEPNRRIDLVIGCSYNDPLREVRRMLEQIVAAEPSVLAVLVGHGGDREGNPRQGHPFAGGKGPSRNRTGIDSVVLRRLHHEFKHPIVDQKPVAGTRHAEDFRHRQGHQVGIGGRLQGERHRLARGHQARRRKVSQAHLRPAQVLQNRDGTSHAGGDGADRLDATSVVGVGAVGEVDPRDIETRAHQSLQPVEIIDGRSERTDNLGASHGGRNRRTDRPGRL